MESSQHNEGANTPQISNTTSGHRPSSETKAADDRGKPGYCPADQLRPHLVRSQAEARLVVRSPENLRLHTVLRDLDMIDVVEELNDAARLRDQSAAEPILITTNGTILAGFGRWRLAVCERRHEIHCIEYQLSEDESLQFMLSHHQTRRGWNAFFRIRLALTLEPYFQQRALDNMRAGGKYKGLANLPAAQHLDVRQQIADLAAVGTRNVSNVKTILKTAHPQLITALLNGTLTINGAMQFCKFSKAQQLEHFIRHIEDREINKVIRRSITRSNATKISLDVSTVLDALQQQEARQSGSVVVQVGRFQHTVILIGQDLLTGPYFQKELDLHEIPQPESRGPLRRDVSYSLSYMSLPCGCFIALHSFCVPAGRRHRRAEWDSRSAYHRVRLYPVQLFTF